MSAVAVEGSTLALWAAVDRMRAWAFSAGAEQPWSIYQELAFHGMAPDERMVDWLRRQNVDRAALHGDFDGWGWPVVMGRAERVGSTFAWRPEDGVRVLVFLARDRDGRDDDLVAWWPQKDRVASLYGTPVLGAEWLDADEPVQVHAGMLDWLRAGRRGVVVVNQRRAIPLLRGVKVLVVDDPAMALRLKRDLTLELPKILVREIA